MTIIKPSVGRKVWYRPGTVDKTTMAHLEGQPLDATIVAVHGDNCVNLVIYDANGVRHTRMSAYMKQGDDVPSWVQGYAEWMPYQIWQAAKESTQA